MNNATICVVLSCESLRSRSILYVYKKRLAASSNPCHDGVERPSCVSIDEFCWYKTCCNISQCF